MKLILYFLLPLLWSAFLSAHAGNLTQVMARQRKNQIAAVSYNLFFEFQNREKTFEAQSIIKVKLNHINLPLLIDYNAGKIKKISINGIDIKDYQIGEGSIEIPGKYLKKENEIEIIYTGSHNVFSFHRYTDALDNTEYFYSNLEPYGAHSIFPCFDQPDLKASFTIKVKAPAEWKIIHNAPSVSELKEEKNTIWKFKSTPPISTYLFFLGGGNYEEWQDSHNGIPLKIYSRKSLAKHVDPGNIFDVTKKGLDFFEDYFSYKYPFAQYAHIFVPNFSTVGMENAGAVTLNEKFILSGNVSDSYISRRKEVILHEMVHMWFGNLVTMDWWDGLWLNESFASYMASIVNVQISNEPKSYLFFTNLKIWAQGEEATALTSHPVVTDVPDILAASGSFDGITYQKGASAIKQLHSYVGNDDFKAGVRNYFKKNAFKNTTLKDFIHSIDMYSKKDLQTWLDKWLLTSGPNKIESEFSCKDGKVESFIVKQSPNYSGALLPHKTEFGFFNKKSGQLILSSVVTVAYETAETSMNLTDRTCPDFVLPNYRDLDYGNFKIDSKSMKEIKLALATLPDSLSRLQLWIQLQTMIRDGVLDPVKYINIVAEALKVETDDLLLTILLGLPSNRITAFKDPYLLYLSPEERKIAAPELEKILLDRVAFSKLDHSLRLMLFNFYIFIARSPASQERLVSFIKSGTGPEGMALNRELRWAIIQNLAMNKHPDSLKLISEEQKNDSSLYGKKMELVSLASYPDPKLKEELWKYFLNPKDKAFDVGREASEYIHNVDHPELSNPYLVSYFERSIAYNWNANPGMIDFNFYRLFPVQVCSEYALKLSEKYLQKIGHFNPYAKRRWLLSHNELAQCVSIRAR